MDDIRAMGAGATFSEVSKSDLEHFVVAVPPLHEQRRITERLSNQLAAVTRLRDDVAGLMSTMSIARQALIDAAFAPDTAHTRLDQIASLTDGDWILNADYSPSGVRLIQVGDVGVGALRLRSERFVTTDRAIELGCTFLGEGDVLISRMADPIGRALVLPDLGYPAITAVDVAIARIDRGLLDPHYFVMYTQTRDWLSAVSAMSSGATRPRISRSNLGSLKVPTPAIEEQKRSLHRLRTRLAALDVAQDALVAERVATESLPAALLRQALAHN
jgi:restriction endonuclease S subunit